MKKKKPKRKQQVQFYVYLHKTNTGKVFYVGKGQGKRAWALSCRTRKHQNVVNKYGCQVEIIWYATCEEQAYAIEMMNIDFHGTYHYDDPKGIGCNFTRGGPSIPGYVHTKKLRSKWSKQRRGKKLNLSVQARQKRSDSKLGDKNPMRNPSSARKMVETKRVKNMGKLSTIQRDSAAIVEKQKLIDAELEEKLQRGWYPSGRTLFRWRQKQNG